MSKCSEILRELKKGGWYVDRQKGSHIILMHSERKDFISFPNHGSKEIAIGTLNSILKIVGEYYGKPKK